MKNKKTLIIIAVVVVLVIIAAAALYFFGQNLGGTVRVRGNVKENRVNIEITAGEEFNHVYKSAQTSFTAQPQIAIWAEDMNGNYITTLFVTRKTAKGDFGSTNGQKNVRSESLPVWSHKAAGDAAIDAVTSATPKDSVIVNTPIEYTDGPFMLFVEVNNSADYNEYYTEENRDSGENASLWSGQPSIVYGTAVLPGAALAYDLTPIGHGKADGSDGSVEPDMSKITTALSIIDSIKIVSP